MSTQTSALERLRVPLPSGFDPSRHADALVAKVCAAKGGGWELSHLDASAGVAVLTRMAAITEMAATTDAKTFSVKLPKTVRPTDGEKMAARLEDEHPGYYLTGFEPFLGRATLTKMDEDTVRCRGAAASALGVKPWDVQVTPRRGGGFDLALPKSYMPSKHDAKLEEVATGVVGQYGWVMRTDPARLTASMIPGEPPTFPVTIPYPLDQLGKWEWGKTPFGWKLASPGGEDGEIMTIDWTASAFALWAGTPGSGKSVSLAALIAGELAAGSELVIVDDPAKSVDFLWCKSFVRPGGWGCDSDKAAVASLAMVYEEGQRRAKVLAESGYVNWLDMPEGQRFTPIFIVVDELSALLVPEKMPGGIPKDHPLALEIAERNLMRAQLSSYITKIIAELRFVGMRMVLSTQVTNATTGVAPSLKAKIGHKVLQGSNPSKSARDQAFNDSSSVPEVPEHIRGAGKIAKGVGSAELEGAPTAVFKGFYASIGDYKESLLKLKVPTTTRPEPTAAEIAKYTPSLDDTGYDTPEPKVLGERTPSGKPLDPKFGPDPDLAGLSGFEKANATRSKLAGKKPGAAKAKTEAAQEKEWAAQSGEVTVRKAPICPDCSKPISPTGDCGCDW